LGTEYFASKTHVAEVACAMKKFLAKTIAMGEA
jgi:hypothetical protein